MVESGHATFLEYRYPPGLKNRSHHLPSDNYVPCFGICSLLRIFGTRKLGLIPGPWDDTRKTLKPYLKHADPPSLAALRTPKEVSPPVLRASRVLGPRVLGSMRVLLPCSGLCCCLRV